MRKSLIALLAVLSMLGTVSVTALPSLNVMPPVKCSPDDTTPDGRVFPEPRFTATFLTFADFECGIGVLDELHPDLVEITDIGTSNGGAPIYNVKVTNEAIDEGDKQHMLILSSIHGNEHAGREGGARFIEDMVSGDFRAEEGVIDQVLDRFVVHFVFPNPDGWINGDMTADGGGVNFTRANDGSRDLNRNFPVQGYLRASNGTLDQPEGRGLEALLAEHADLVNDPDSPEYRGWSLGTDNHGQGAKPVAASGLQIVGQFDYGKSETLAHFADSISTEMQGEALTAIETLNQATGGAVQPYEWGTLYDILGYSAAGSGIDYYNSPVTITGVGVEGTGFATEMTASNLPFSNILTHPGEVNQMWVETVRAINYAMFKTAVEAPTFEFPVGGDAAYVLDPNRTTSDDANGFGPGNDPENRPGNFTGDDPAFYPDYADMPYSVSRMEFFRDLNSFATNPLDEVTVEGVLDGTVDLADYDSLVLADMVIPAGLDFRSAEWLAALDAYVTGGGNLILTDAALQALPALFDEISEEEVDRITSNVGFADFAGEGDLNEGLRGIASQTYDVIPIGYPDNAGQAPNWRVSAATVGDLGGTIAGTNGGEAIYGQIASGEGTVSFLGALLPEPTEDFFHPYGLQNYAVTYTGYTLLENMLDTAS